jgi:hypothetical protein
MTVNLLMKHRKLDTYEASLASYPPFADSCLSTTTSFKAFVVRVVLPLDLQLAFQVGVAL